MYNIRYYYASLAKQSFILITILYLIARMAIFHVAGFDEHYYTVPSMMMYLILIGFCILCFMGYKLYTVSFDDSTITATNHILKSSKSLSYGEINKAMFKKTGIYLYDTSEKLLLHIPIYFFGKISPVGVENFEIMLKNKGIKEVRKTYKTLPGFGRVSVIISYTFFFLCIPFLLSTVQLIEIIFMLL